MSRPDFESWVKTELADLRELVAIALEASGVEYEGQRSAAPAPMLRTVAEAVQPALDRLAEAVNAQAECITAQAAAINAQADRRDLIAKTQSVKIIHRDENGELSYVEDVQVRPAK